MSGHNHIRAHNHRLIAGPLQLRPMSESDWPVLLRWNQDPRVLAYWDAAPPEPWSLEKLQSVYRGISQRAFMFMIDWGERSIGECWVQEMNLPELRNVFPGKDVRRIDISIGEPELWGKGLGTEVVRALVRFGFGTCRADALFACHVSDANPRSLRVFEKSGFVEYVHVSEADRATGSGPFRHLVLLREDWEKQGAPETS